jgi:Sulfotransferase family
MQDTVNRPIFVVGSPRSGTSILAWCFGQHPNIIPVPESNWMGQFVINLAISYEIGSARGDRSLLSGMDIGREEFFANFGRSINDMVLSHRKDLDRKRKITRPSLEPKRRWVDQTPEYSLHICGLRKLFPKALFVHILRDVTSVVHSMLNFHRVSGIELVTSEQEAYDYWLRTVSSCLDAEHAYGPSVIHRLRYSDLVNSPELTLRSVFRFLGEPYAQNCVNPLRKRINSSNVPADFKADDPATDRALIAKARRLSAELDRSEQPREASLEVARRLEEAFNQRVQHIAQASSEYQKSRQIISELQKRVSANSGTTIRSP